MPKYKGIIEMKGVDFRPIYRDRHWTILNTAKIEIKKVQKLSNGSYNVTAKILVFEKSDENDWIKIDECIVEPA